MLRKAGFLIACIITFLGLLNYTQSSIQLPFEIKSRELPENSATRWDIEDSQVVVDDSQLEAEEDDESQPARPTIGKVSMMYGDPNPVYERALESHREHARRHGYSVHVNRQKMLGRLWTKPAYLLYLVLGEMAKPPEERLKWIFWFDADTVIVNPSLPLETFLPPANMPYIHFLCGNDHNGLNDGAFLLRVNDFAVHMLSASLSVETYRPEVDLRFSEQSAIEHVVNSKDVYRPWDGTTYRDGFAQIPQRWLNGYMGARDDEGFQKPGRKIPHNGVREGDLLLHFAGSGDKKRQRITTFMDSWDANKSMWDKPVVDAGLEAEISEYWSKLARKYKELPSAATSTSSAILTEQTATAANTTERGEANTTERGDLKRQDSQLATIESRAET